MSLQVTGLFAASLKRSSTLRAERDSRWGSLVPIGGSTGESHIFQHARSQAGETAIEFGFHLAQGGAGVGQAPVGHASGELLAQCLPGLVKRGL